MKAGKTKKRILIISHDKIGTSMAGPGIRYHYMAQVLSDDFDVTVGFFDPNYLPDQKLTRDYSIEHIDAHNFHGGFENFDIIIALWLSPRMISFCNSKGIFIVFDLYAPVPIENLAGNIFGKKRLKPSDDFEFSRSLVMYRLFFENGDLFLCSNRRQLDFWLGYVFGSDQIRPTDYLTRPMFDRFIFAPMGIDAKSKLEHKKNVIKGVIPGIKKTDKIILWTGGIWEHFDAQVLIRAMSKLSKRKEIKLLFFGTRHPNPTVPDMRESIETRKLAEEMGLLGKNVFFQDGWVDYVDRIDYLLEADIAISTHKPSIEAEFSHRTRILDHLLAELPTIATSGDYFSDDVIKRYGLGVVVPPNDELVIEKSILEIFDENNYNKVRSNIKKVRKDFDWEVSLRPLKDFLLSNPDKLTRTKRSHNLRDDKGIVLVAKRILPPTAKKRIVKALRLSN